MLKKVLYTAQKEPIMTFFTTRLKVLALILGIASTFMLPTIARPKPAVKTSSQTPHYEVAERINVDGPVFSSALSFNGKLLLLGLDDRVIILEIESKTFLKTIESPEGPVVAVALSQDNSILFVGSQAGTGKLWNLSTRSNPIILSQPIPEVRGAIITADTKTLITASKGGIQQWDTKTGKLLFTLKNGEGVGATSLALSKDEKTIVAGLSSGDVLIGEASWDGVKQTIQHSTQGQVTAVALSPTGLFGALGLGRELLSMWDGSNSSLKPNITMPFGYINALAFNPTGTTLLVSSTITASLWDPVKGWILAYFQDLEQPMGTISWVTFTPEEKVITISQSNPVEKNTIIRLWQKRT